MDTLEGTSRGAQGFGSIGIQSTDDCQTIQQRTNQSMTESAQSESKISVAETMQNPIKFNKTLMDKPSQNIKKRSHTAKTW